MLHPLLPQTITNYRNRSFFEWNQADTTPIGCRRFFEKQGWHNKGDNIAPNGLLKYIQRPVVATAMVGKTSFTCLGIHPKVLPLGDTDGGWESPR